MDHPKDHSLFGLGLPGYIVIDVTDVFLTKKWWLWMNKGHVCFQRLERLEPTWKAYDFINEWVGFVRANY